MPIKKWNKIQTWGRKWNINNLKTNPDDLKIKNNASWSSLYSETAIRIAAMNKAKLMQWITGWRKRKYTPEELLNKINEYFTLNMIFEEVYDGQNWEVIDYKFQRMKAMSIFWLCNHLEISYSSFREMASTKKYWEICLQAKQKIMDHYIVWWLEWEFDSKVASIIVNMQMQNERIEEGLREGDNNFFQKIEINVITKDWEEKKKIDPIKIINIDPKK